MEKEEAWRPFPEFPPSVWGSTFASLLSNYSEFEDYTTKVETLKEEVRQMLIQSNKNWVTNIEFINLLCRLGVSYHFEIEISNQLNQIFNTISNQFRGKDYDIYIVAVLFRILRQYGYKMSSDVFKAFKNDEGKFNDNIATNVKGLLSLYEACFLCVHGEHILDEALGYTKKHLEIFVNESPETNLTKHVRKSLTQPFHRGIERLEAMEYISFYEQQESPNTTLLTFAKLDFNRLQYLYRKEIASVSRWWNELNLAKKLPHARDRIVECYFWVLGSLFEPQYSSARIIGTKYIKMVSIMDDTYDTYGTIDELTRLTSSLHRCAIDAMDSLPNYMKVIYRTMLDLFGETENFPNEGVRYRTSFAKEMFQELVRSYFVEAQWLNNDEYVPPFAEYFKNGLITSTYGAVSSAVMIGIDELRISDYEWMKSNPKIVEAAELLGRMMNDIKPHEVEYTRRDIPMGLKSYMKQNHVSEGEAIEAIQAMCLNAWKDINKALMEPNVGSTIITKHFLNHARVTGFIYKSRDLYTYPTDMKHAIESLFSHQFEL